MSSLLSRHRSAPPIHTPYTTHSSSKIVHGMQPYLLWLDYLKECPTELVYNGMTFISLPTADRLAWIHSQWDVIGQDIAGQPQRRQDFRKKGCFFKQILSRLVSLCFIMPHTSPQSLPQPFCASIPDKWAISIQFNIIDRVLFRLRFRPPMIFWTYFVAAIRPRRSGVAVNAVLPTWAWRTRATCSSGGTTRRCSSSATRSRTSQSTSPTSRWRPASRRSKVRPAVCIHYIPVITNVLNFGTDAGGTHWSLRCTLNVRGCTQHACDQGATIECLHRDGHTRCNVKCEYQCNNLYPKVTRWCWILILCTVTYRNRQLISNFNAMCHRIALLHADTMANLRLAQQTIFLCHVLVSGFRFQEAEGNVFSVEIGECVNMAENTFQRGAACEQWRSTQFCRPAVSPTGLLDHGLLLSN